MISPNRNTTMASKPKPAPKGKPVTKGKPMPKANPFVKGGGKGMKGC